VSLDVETGGLSSSNWAKSEQILCQLDVETGGHNNFVVINVVFSKDKILQIFNYMSFWSINIFLYILDFVGKMAKKVGFIR
jgi:hypothetical protein